MTMRWFVPVIVVQVACRARLTRLGLGVALLLLLSDYTQHKLKSLSNPGKVEAAAHAGGGANYSANGDALLSTMKAQSPLLLSVVAC